MQPHIHKDLIIAWANGEEIQYLSEVTNRWHDITWTPDWDIGSKYRVKPKPSMLDKLMHSIQESGQGHIQWNMNSNATTTISITADTVFLEKALRELCNHAQA